MRNECSGTWIIPILNVMNDENAECWHALPRRAPLSVFWPKRVVTWHHDILCHHMSWQNESVQVNPSETPKSRFPAWQPWPWPSNSSKILSESTLSHIPHTQTDWTDFIPTTAEAGGKNKSFFLYVNAREHLLLSTVHNILKMEVKQSLTF